MNESEGMSLPPRPSSAASGPAPLNHVFVDFENVPSVDLALIRGRPADVTLLIGEKQRRLDLDLVRQIHEHATQVSLVEVGASGRNALDLVLAWHLGHAAEQHPKDTFFVVSKDKDFDPLIKHLRARGLEVARVDAFSALPFVAAPERSPRTNAPRRRAAATAPTERARSAQSVTAAAVATSAPAKRRNPERAVTNTATTNHTGDPRLVKLIDRLQHKTKARPVRRKTLLSHINGFYANRLTAPELEEVLTELQKHGIISLDAQDRVTYPASH
jgi:hypothetical protein